ncbi:MAG: hypothetical protein LLF96_02755 [Eubacteriales bacterium]|nr:hypothetical protein [Eubacteriales bacterium]
MEEILVISDEVTIMRGGKSVGMWPACELTTDLMIRRMVSRNLTRRFPPRENVPGDTFCGWRACQPESAFFPERFL